MLHDGVPYYKHKKLTPLSVPSSLCEAPQRVCCLRTQNLKRVSCLRTQGPTSLFGTTTWQFKTCVFVQFLIPLCLDYLAFSVGNSDAVTLYTQSQKCFCAQNTPDKSPASELLSQRMRTFKTFIGTNSFQEHIFSVFQAK